MLSLVIVKIVMPFLEEFPWNQIHIAIVIEIDCFLIFRSSRFIFNSQFYPPFAISVVANTATTGYRCCLGYNSRLDFHKNFFKVGKDFSLWVQARRSHQLGHIIFNAIHNNGLHPISFIRFLITPNTVSRHSFSNTAFRYLTAKTTWICTWC